jgi:hypothetical protein
MILLLTSTTELVINIRYFDTIYNDPRSQPTSDPNGDYALFAFKAAKPSRLPVDLGSKYGLSPKLTDRVPVRLISSRSCVAASVH